jgi:hypothetical protein
VQAPVLFESSTDAPRGLIHDLARPYPLAASERAALAEPEGQGDDPSAEPVGGHIQLPPPRQLRVSEAAPVESETLTHVPTEQLPRLEPALPPPPSPPAPGPLPVAATPPPPAPEIAAESVALPGAFEPAPSPPAGSRLNLGQSRRAGLGPPLAEPPPPAPERTRPLGMAMGLGQEGVFGTGTPPPAPPIPEGPPAPPPQPRLGPPLPAPPRAIESPPAGAEPPPPLLHAPVDARPSDAEPVEEAAPVGGAPAAPPPPPPPPPPRTDIPGPVVPVFRPPSGAEPVVVTRPAERAGEIAAEIARLAAPTTEPVPPALRAELRRLHRVDVGDKPVRRGPDAGDQADAMGARAFARDGEVFLPADEGPLDRPKTRGLLAHELTHVAQQRELGPRLPDEGTPGGRLLEAHATEAERWFGGEPGATEPTPISEVAHRHLPVVDHPLADLVAMVARELPPELSARARLLGVGDLLPPPLAPSVQGAPVASGVQRRPVAPSHAITGLSSAGRSGGDFPAISAGDIEEYEHERDTQLLQRVRENQEQALREVFEEKGWSEEQIDEFMREATDTYGLGNLDGGGAGGVRGRGTGGPGGGNRQLQNRLDELRQAQRLAAETGAFMTGAAWGELEGEIAEIERQMAGGQQPTKSGDAKRRDEIIEAQNLAAELGILMPVDVIDEMETEKNRLAEADVARQEEQAKARTEREEQRRRQQIAGEGLSMPEREEQSAEFLESLDMDALANRLYLKLRSRLRTELLVDRERAGLLADFR